MLTKNRGLILCPTRGSELFRGSKYDTEQGPLSLLQKLNVISRVPFLGLKLIKISPSVLKNHA